ncbi:MAG TPA: DUF4340 domain-containing protein, partial [bacterium]|nr:DUF4340 domain-containing protein [bacterium]
LGYPASNWVVDEMVGTLMTLSKVRVLTPEKEWEEYGLLRPTIKIGIETVIHPGRRYLFLGNESPVGDSVYARWQESDDFFVVDSKLKQTFDRSLYAVREKRVFRISPDSIYKIQFRSGSELYELARRKNQWVWIRPRVRRGMTVDPVSSEEFSTQIRDLFIKDFLDPDKEKVDTSFFKIAATVTIWGASKQKEIFYLGQEAPVRDAFYGKREGEDGLLLVDRSNLRAFFETVRTMGSPVVSV